MLADPRRVASLAAGASTAVRSRVWLHHWRLLLAVERRDFLVAVWAERRLCREISSTPGALADLVRPVAGSVTDMGAPQKERREREKGDSDESTPEIAPDEKDDPDDYREDGAIESSKPGQHLTREL